MPHRRDLRGIAHGLAGSFTSRNNDHRGYWALGVLYAHAVRHHVHTVLLDLSLRRLTPDAAELVPVADRYADLLGRKIDKTGMQPHWLGSAQIIVEFGSAAKCDRIRQTYGDPYVCRVILQDDRGRTYEATACGHAAPHDSRRESRRYAFDEPRHPE